MKFLKKLFPFLIAMTSFTVACAQQANTASKVFEVSSPAVVTIVAADQGEKMQGSGVVIFNTESSSQGGHSIPSISHVLTNAHVVGNAKNVRVRIGDKEYPGDVIGLDDELDFAQIVEKEFLSEKLRFQP